MQVEFLDYFCHEAATEPAAQYEKFKSDSKKQCLFHFSQ
jgi:hypothetical protein